MKYELTQDDIKLINQALDSITPGMFMGTCSATTTAVEQRVKQIKEKLVSNEAE